MLDWGGDKVGEVNRNGSCPALPHYSKPKLPNTEEVQSEGGNRYTVQRTDTLPEAGHRDNTGLLVKQLLGAATDTGSNHGCRSMPARAEATRTFSKAATVEAPTRPVPPSTSTRFLAPSFPD